MAAGWGEGCTLKPVQQGSFDSLLWSYHSFTLIPSFLPHTASTPHTFSSTSGWNQGYFSLPPPMCHTPIFQVALGCLTPLSFLQGCYVYPHALPGSAHHPQLTWELWLLLPTLTVAAAHCSTVTWTHCRAQTDEICHIQFPQREACMAACAPGPSWSFSVSAGDVGPCLWGVAGTSAAPAVPMQWDKGDRDLKAAFATLSLGCCRIDPKNLLFVCYWASNSHLQGCWFLTCWIEASLSLPT